MGYTPLVTMVTAHHMNMVACENPASNETYWFVIEYIYWKNHPKIFEEWRYPRLWNGCKNALVWLGSRCLTISSLRWYYPSSLNKLSIWSDLFSDIGIVIGKNTPYRYLVVNIHFVPMVKNDYSGSQLLLSRKRCVKSSISY